MCWASESDFVEAETALIRKLTDHVELCTLSISVLRSLLMFLASSALRFSLACLFCFQWCIPVACIHMLGFYQCMLV
jgi:hypothetical protein